MAIYPPEQQQHTEGADYGMDMGYLVDRLEALINAGRRLPLGHVLVNEQEILEIIDQMRISVPNEINQARRVIQEREQIINNAQMEAEKIVTMARDRAEYMLNDDGLLLQAKAHAEGMLAEARKESESLRTDSVNYAAEKLTQLEENCEKILREVRRGLEELRNS